MTSSNDQTSTGIQPTAHELETILFNLEISNSFGEWASNLDTAEAPARAAAGVQLLYRGVNGNGPNDVTIILQAKEGIIERYVAANAASFRSDGSGMETVLSQSYIT